jgi:hexosaminidase
MYRRLEVVNQWLEWLGLTQRSNLELMRARLAGDFPVGPLDKFSSVLEPVKGYVRHGHKYTSLSPFNHLVDSIPPESEPARKFRSAVDAYLASDKKNSRPLREQLTSWKDAAQNVQPMMRANSLLAGDVPVAEGVKALSEAGIQALDYLESGKTIPVDWKAGNSAMLSKYNNKRVGEFMLIQIASAVDKLVSAVK